MADVWRVKDAAGTVLGAFRTEREAEAEREHLSECHGYEAAGLEVAEGPEVEHEVEDEGAE